MGGMEPALAFTRTSDDVSIAWSSILVPLPFGAPTQWVRNVLAAGSCTIRWRGRDHLVTNPRIVAWAEARAAFHPALRVIAPRIGIHTYLRVDEVA
jgi:hypothetical protein